MGIKRIIRCDVCGAEYTEEIDGAGFPGWGALHGVEFNGSPNPNLCPKHLGEMAEHMDKLKAEVS